MKRLALYKWSILVLIVYVATSLYFYSAIPAGTEVPIHWNFKNEIDGWASRDGHLAMALGLVVLIWAAIFAMPFYSPRYKEYEERNEKIMPVFATLLVFFLGGINLYSQYIAIRGEEPGGIKFILVIIGLMFICMGNLLPKIPSNFMMGIKTPWTLSDPDNWHRTHRMGGWLYFLAGVLMVIKGFVPYRAVFFHTLSSIAFFVLLIYPLLYSFLLYHKQKQK